MPFRQIFRIGQRQQAMTPTRRSHHTDVLRRHAGGRCSPPYPPVRPGYLEEFGLLLAVVVRAALTGAWHSVQR
eukprot:6212596-Pleurochrysis_carterae.AAC.7